MRRPIKKRNKVQPDPVHGSTKVERLVNYLMWEGKKHLARKTVYDAFALVEKELGMNPIEAFDLAVKNTGPTVEVRSRRVGGANYQVPVEVRPDRRIQLSLRWIISAARSGSGRTMAERLARELISASKNEGSAVKKRDDVHKMAEANKAFAHLTW